MNSTEYWGQENINIPELFSSLAIKNFEVHLSYAKTIALKKTSQVWWHTRVIPALRRWRQEHNSEFEAIPGYIAIQGQPQMPSKTLSHKTKKKKNPKNTYSIAVLSEDICLVLFEILCNK